MNDLLGMIAALMRRWWRIPVIGLLAAIVAFAGSYVVSPEYVSSTRLLLRGRDATFLTTTGQNLSKQPGVVDASLAKALAETQTALVSSRTVAEMVVEELNLDRPKPPATSLVGKARSAARNLYVRTRAILEHGFFRIPDGYTAAVDGVYSGLSATPLKDSYVIELEATADDPKLAAAIADTAADSLVTVSRKRFREEAASYRDFLGRQLERAGKEQEDAGKAVRDYKTAHGISDVGVEIELSAATSEQLRSQLRATEIELTGKRAQLASIDRQLASIAKTDSDVTKVQTGRSETAIEETKVNPLYASLQQSSNQLQAEVDALVAKEGAIRRRLTPSSDAALTEDQAELRQLELRHLVASDTFKDLSGQYQAAVVTSESDTVELTRVDRANVPTYPARPLRYLYLALGAMFGAAAGYLFTWLASRRPPAPAPEPVRARADVTVAVSSPAPAGAMATAEPRPERPHLPVPQPGEAG
jgi:uncharacterized protein involved in exopolysaccharide biosynthesis